MTLSRKFTSLAVAAAVAAGGLMPLASAANAGPRHHKYGYSSHYGYADPYYGRSHRYGYYRKKKRNHAGKAIAIGAGLLMLGIIASEAGRKKYRYRYR